MNLLQLLRTQPFWRDAAWSVAWVLIMVILRAVALRVVRTKKWPSDTMSLRLIAQVKRGSWLLMGLGLLLLWATELKTMALSLAALAVAIVLATKELWLCVMGSLVRASSAAYTIGDRVHIGNSVGDVIDYGLFATTLLEVGPGHRWTGRTLTVPNSLLLTHPVINATHSGDYVLHVIRSPITADADVDDVEQRLLEIALDVSEDYIEDARDQLSKHAMRLGHATPTLEPRVLVQLSDAATYHLILRLPVPARNRADVEQRVLRAYLARSSATAHDVPD